MSNEPCHGPDERLDREGLGQHGRRSEFVGLFGRPFVPRAHNDRGRGITLLDAMHPRTSASAVISLEADEVGDDEFGKGLRWDILQPIHQQQLVALIAQHLAKEVSSRPVVLNDQDVSYTPQVRGFGNGAQF